MKIVKIGNKYVGDGYQTYIIFEAGQTHQGFENAKELIDIASKAGADAIKFQIFDSERLVSSRDILDIYEVIDKKTGQTKIMSEPLVESFKRHELTFEQWKELKQYADSKNIDFFATVCFPEEVDFVVSLNVPAIKICSADINHHWFIKYVARKKIPIMIDTGSSTIGEVEQTVDIIRNEGNEQIVIHHCPSGFPATLESINLRMITTLKQMFNYPIAFSDHSPGWDMCIAAVSLGANMIEKTITSDRAIQESEHIASIEPQEAKRIVQAIRNLEIALGEPRREFSRENFKKVLEKRRSIFAKVDLHVGQIISEKHIDFRRPGTGIPANFYNFILGARVGNFIKSGTMISWKDIEICDGPK
ncbi:MAG: N-acetylneuraminate synthase family protein [Thermoplasmata archaeon]|nr:N-acetylneuraminate synthase family protein [Thermoplasmata archaeon]